MIRTLGAIALISLLGTPRAQEMKTEVLDKLKSATVYVKASESTGSGFLFLKRGTTGYIMTCEHVVGAEPTVRVVFWSGTAQEKTYTAKVVATDPSRDIACLIVRDAEGLPAPLDLGRKTEVRETETVFAAGFPFGGMLAAGRKNPEISISKSSVTSIRRNDAREVVLIQISGEVNPGNSGGPLVGADGRVIGVTALKLMGTQTAFAVPPEEIQGFLKGRVKAVSFRMLESNATRTKYEIVLDLVDPLATLKGAGLAYLDRKLVKEEPRPEKDGTWKKAHPSMKTIDCTIDEDRAVKTVEFTRDGTDAEIVYQCFFVRADGQRFWTEPSTLGIGSSGSPAAGRGPRRDPPPSNPPPSNPPPRDDPPEPPAPERPAGPVVDLAIPDQPLFSAELKVASVFGGLFLAPDGSALYALDLSEGQVYKLDPDTLEIKARVDVLESAVTLAMTPDGKTLYVAGRTATPRNGKFGKDESGTPLQIVSTATLKVTGTLQLQRGVIEIVATDQGRLITSTPSQGGGVTIIDVSQKSEEDVLFVPGAAVIRLSGDQRRVYFGDTLVSPADFRCLPLRREQGTYHPYDSVYHGEYPLGGYFELTPDGNYLVGGVGTILRLGRARDADLKYLSRIERFQTAVMAVGCSTLFTTSPEGVLKAYSIGTFDLRKSVALGFRCDRAVLDAKRKRIYGVFGEPDTRQQVRIDRQPRIGKIACLPLEGK